MKSTRSVPGDDSRDGDQVGSGKVTTGLRERKKLETFRALRAAARHLVGERGLAKVTVDEIAAAANVSKRTFFNYFDSKEAAIVDPEPGVAERLAAALAARPATETPLQALWEAAIGLLVQEAPAARTTSELMAANPALTVQQMKSFGKFEQVIMDWAAERTGCDPATSVYPALLAGLAAVVVQLSVTRWRPETGDEGFIQVAHEVFGLLAGGLAAPRSIDLNGRSSDAVAGGA